MAFVRGLETDSKLNFFGALSVDAPLCLIAMRHDTYRMTLESQVCLELV